MRRFPKITRRGSFVLLLVLLAVLVTGSIAGATGTPTFLTKWGTLGSGDGQFNSPFSVAVDNSGNVYVVDSGNNRVEKFDSSGTFLTAWGSFGSGDGQFSSPRGVAVGPSGNVYVVDTNNNR